MIDVGTRRQLFIDERFIASRSGVTLTMNPPVQHAEPVLTPDKPWEELGIGAYNTVWREPDGTFRLWYDALLKGGLPQEGASPTLRMRSVTRRTCCSGTSASGSTWATSASGRRSVSMRLP